MNYLKGFFFFCLFLTSCQKIETDLGDLSGKGLPEQEGWGVEITLSESGLIRAIIKANHLQKFETDKKVNLDGNVVADFFDVDEKHTTLLLSEYAEIDENTKFMKAIGHVIVVSDSGITLVTDTLSLDQENELIFTEDTVRLTTTNMDTLYGIGFESNIHLSEWKILKPWGVTDINNE